MPPTPPTEELAVTPDLHYIPWAPRRPISAPEVVEYEEYELLPIIEEEEAPMPYADYYGEVVYMEYDDLDYLDDAPPATEDINVAPFATVLIFTEGSIEYLLNGQRHVGVASPFIDMATDRMMIPLRTIAEALGIEVAWDSATRSALLFLPTETIIIPADEMLPGDMGSAMMVNNRIFVPLRFAMYAFDAIVEWDHENRSAIITVSE